MLNNEIRRLVRCLVEASAESNIKFEEIQAEIARQFGKEIQPQYIEPENFRKNVKRFIKYELNDNCGYGKIEKVIELFCIFYELRCETPEEDMVSTKEIEKKFMERCSLKQGGARPYFYYLGGRLQSYMLKKKGICIEKYSSISKIFQTVYPFIEQM